MLIAQDCQLQVRALIIIPAVLVNYTKLATDLRALCSKRTRTHGVFALNSLHVTLVWTAPPNSAHVRSNVLRT